MLSNVCIFVLGIIIEYELKTVINLLCSQDCIIKLIIDIRLENVRIGIELNNNLWISEETISKRNICIYIYIYIYDQY